MSARLRGDELNRSQVKIAKSSQARPGRTSSHLTKSSITRSLERESESRSTQTMYSFMSTLPDPSASSLAKRSFSSDSSCRPCSPEMRWNGMGWDGTGWDGMGRDGMGWDER
jgi:hypothetical protein